MSEPTASRVTVTAYFVVFFSLLGLTALTTAIAYVNLGPLNVFAALTIAAVKAALVFLYFMHLRESPRLIWLFTGAGFLWLLLLIGLIMSDVATRLWIVAT
jgi:cytochrome c oxidase subunit IV